jgi:23S rRNA (cytidine1920-2'-O)/16S rRNA (cytidine1409-2'-O)-methyltransferase
MEVLDRFVKNAQDAGFFVKKLTYSPIKGPEGNIEYLGHLTTGGEPSDEIDTTAVVKASHAELSEI